MSAGLPRPLICLVTDRRRVRPAGENSLLRLIGGAARAGIDLVQIREAALTDRQLLQLTRGAVAAVSGTATRILVNDRADVAIAAGAHGVHLRADSVSAGHVRTLSPPGFTVGRSVHSRAEAIEAARSGVDYLVAGTVYATPSKPGHTSWLGISGLSDIVGAVDLPVLAIGGVVADKVWDVAATGAAGVAAIGLFADVRTDDNDGRVERALRDLLAGLRAPFRGGPAPG